MLAVVEALLVSFRSKCRELVHKDNPRVIGASGGTRVVRVMIGRELRLRGESSRDLGISQYLRRRRLLAMFFSPHDQCISCGSPEATREGVWGTRGKRWRL